MPRRGPLHACGISIIEILGKASTKTKDFDGPIGSMTKRVFTLVTTSFPFILTLQDQWLAILSYADDRILAVESAVETLFPPSKHLFNKIDKLVYVAESLPVKFDDAMNKFPIIIHQVPFLDWAVAYVILWLNFLIIALTQWGSNSMKEKEIVVDINFGKPGIQTVPLEHPDCSAETTKIPHRDQKVEIPSNVPDSSQDENKELLVKESSSRKTEYTKTENKELVVEESSSKKTECSKTENKELVVKESSSEKTGCTKTDNLSPPSDSSEDEGEENEKRSKNVNLFSKNTPQRRRSYKEILESGTKESTTVKKENLIPKPIPPKATTSEKKEEKGAKKEEEDEDKSDSKSDLLELFDASWHLSPPSRR